MPDAKLAVYQPVDTLYLWWLGQPDQPRLVGTLATVRAFKGQLPAAPVRSTAAPG